jgi:hypothetical protein
VIGYQPWGTLVTAAPHMAFSRKTWRILRNDTFSPPYAVRRRETDCLETRPGEYHPWVHLATDYIHPISRGGRCRVRVYLPDEELDAPVVVCSELPTNAEQLAAAQGRERPRHCGSCNRGG